MKRSIKRRLEVFIGATRKDLEKARVRVQEAVLESGHFPSGMELWNSETTPVRETILRHLSQCDVHILIVGARYGEYVDPLAERKMSFTEWEYRESRRLNKKIIVFLMNDDSYRDARKIEIRNDKGEKDRDADFQRFRKELKSSQFSRTFSGSNAGIAKLGRLCVSALNELANSESLADYGWVRVEDEDAVRAKAIRENQFLSRVIDRLQQFSKLTDRVQQQPKEKQAVAEFFWDTMAGSIRRTGYRHLFFESGSSIAYVSQQFEETVLMAGDDAAEWQIKSNNVETLLQLLLHTDLSIQPMPAAAPDPQDKYGAIFPREFRFVREPAPSKPRALYKKSSHDKGNQYSEVDAMIKVKKEFADLGDKKLLVLATTSGLDLCHKEPFFRGPHVGSHPNMLFKRALLTAGLPVVLFLDSKKFDQPFKERECFPVFGPGCSWDEVRKNYPIAICTAWEQSEMDLKGSNDSFQERVKRDLHALNALGFDTRYAIHTAPEITVVIAANRAFQKILPMS